MIKEANRNDLETYKKSKTIVLFTVLWCGECIMVKPIFEKLSNEYTDINFVTIDVDKHELWKAEVEKGDSEHGDEYLITEVPTFIGFNNEEVKFRTTNFKTEKELRELINKL